jgi:hypothetical protein
MVDPDLERTVANPGRQVSLLPAVEGAVLSSKKIPALKERTECNALLAGMKGQFEG